MAGVTAELATLRAEVARLTAEREARDLAVARHALKAAADQVLDMQGRSMMGHPHANAAHDSALSRVAATVRALDPEALVKGMEG